MGYSDEFGGFKSYKCVRCKNVFKVTSGHSGFCPFCEKGKIKYERYREAVL